MTSHATHQAAGAAKEALVKVTTDVSDVTRGFTEMLERAEGDLAPIIARLHALHAAHLAALTQQLDADGGDLSGVGSAMGLVHKTVATVRDWVGALDMSALPQILDGEEMIVDSYTAAILETPIGSPANRLLEDHRAALRAQIAVLKD